MTGCPGCARLADELAAARAELDQAHSYRTLGGIPHPSTTDWANWTPPPPASATDPDAPELRRAGFASSTPTERNTR